MTATAFTLADYENVHMDSGDLLSAGVLDTLRHESYLLDMMPFPNLGTLEAKNNRILSLPTIQNRKVNSAYSHSSGSIEQLKEQGYLYGGKTQTDRVYKDASAGLIVSDLEAWNIELYAKGLAYAWNYDFINNLPSANLDGIVGMRYRFAQDLSAQMISAAGIDVSPNATTLSVQLNALYDAIESTIYACDGHTCDVLLMNSTLKLRILSGFRQLGLLKTTEDSFGRMIETWGPGGPKLVDMGTKVDQSTKIFTDTEGATGIVGGGTLTSLMALKFGEEYLTGWQLNPLQTYKYQQGVIHYAEIDWYAGIFITNPRSCAWLYNIQAV